MLPAEIHRLHDEAGSRPPPAVEPASVGDLNALIATAADALRLRTPENAVSILEGVLILEPDSGPAWSMLGTAYQTLGRRDEAIAAYAEALAQDDEDLPAAIALAELQLEAGRHEEARALANWLLLASDEAPEIRQRALALRRRLESRAKEEGA